ncbi:hydroxyproline-2-epimerase [Yersinia pseudotuberculosis]|uniref:4-hydroxyproline epimerase n=1 Tax=Yersinia wautersii TaxID=1341643 RepID=A0ABM9T9S4_9GAMM|nr:MULTISPECIES: 4-hydroxyproline epimerase [Yersinia pseudotuberculosis complex]PSH23109.1 hydroxyproline-2-epimerase [Yersinia pseudotuberculosis]CRG48572.1 4-hydroxyproline epimerase [Yersinia wautersii]
MIPSSHFTALPSHFTALRAIDSHTGGEPTRLIIEGFPDLGRGSMAERKVLFAQQYDAWRRAIILEPRGNDVLVGALLCQPCSPQATAGVIFFNNAGYLGMCGHGTIGVIASLAYLGRISTGEHQLETPVGTVNATLHADGSVTVKNVPAYRYRQQVAVKVAGYAMVVGDIAWGGNWFFLINDSHWALTTNNVDELIAFCWAVRQALEQAGIYGEDGSVIDHIELCVEDDHADGRNFVLCPGKVYDRSPCGTGTSAKLACLAADGTLKPGEIWRQASVIGSEFSGYYQWCGNKVTPFIRGQAFVCADSQLLLDPQDPFVWGIG